MFYTPVKLSEHRGKTKEGFLVIYGCAIARTGFQLYSENEVALEPGPDGIIRIERDPEEVFAPEAMASAEGKDIVDNHPGVDVVPDNWAMLSRGHMQNVRRGTGIEDHLLIADLVFKHPDAIRAVEENPTQELSCGYESRYEIYGPGRAAQRQIRINHVAFLRNISGRCGPACSVRDSAMVQPSKLDLWGQHTCTQCSDTICTCDEKTTLSRIEDSAMRVADWIKRVNDAFKAKDHAALETAMKDADGVMKMTGDPEHNETSTHIHLHLGGPETTKPEGGLPETGETRVSKASDGQVGGETGATFGGKAFFQDAEHNEAFHAEMKGMKDSIAEMGKKCEDGFAEMKKHVDNAMAEMAKKAGTQVDSATGEEPAHEKANRAIEGELKEEAPQYTGDGGMIKARDSAMLVDSFAQTLADAAILFPEISVPTFDSKVAPAQGYDAICNLRRKALTGFAATETGAKVMSQITRTLDFAGCTCREVTSMFRGAVAVRKAQTSNADMRSFTDSEKKGGAGQNGRAVPLTVADIQRMNDEHWAQQQTAE